MGGVWSGRGIGYPLNGTCWKVLLGRYPWQDTDHRKPIVGNGEGLRELTPSTNRGCGNPLLVRHRPAGESRQRTIRYPKEGSNFSPWIPRMTGRTVWLGQHPQVRRSDHGRRGAAGRSMCPTPTFGTDKCCTDRFVPVTSAKIFSCALAPNCRVSYRAIGQGVLGSTSGQ